MTTIVIDANIIISAILNPFGAIPKIIIVGTPKTEFVIPDFALKEVNLHKKKICKYSGISSTDFDMLLSSISAHLITLSSDEISSKTIKTAALLTNDIDSKDILYVALSIELGALLWTGDKKLYNGLRKKRFASVISTQEIKHILKGFY
ncbi:PIN domain-containing protein [Lacibacter sp. MH-610]|uniref:PIN domain-containing protein n=1 Tax=Lacibacter sp. MH-610 TaxID=3020883 RepID=UPI00389265FC